MNHQWLVDNFGFKSFILYLIMKDNFSSHASTYVKFRPVYPGAIYDFILGLAVKRNTAWDCGCGNGQVAGALSENFKQIIASDISEKQIRHAVKKPNIEYLIFPAEDTPIHDHSVDLIIVAQAIHWFDFDSFYKEVKRVSTEEAVIAVWCYELLEISIDVDSVIMELYSEILGEEFWDPERKYIQEHYKTIPFPFEEIPAPAFKIAVSWDFEQLTGYLNTWSAVQHYIRKNGGNPVDQISEKLKQVWGSQQSRLVSFPIYMRIGKIKT